MTTPGQLSSAVGAVRSTTGISVLHCTVIPEGHEMVGFSVSLTVTVKLQSAVLPLASVTSKVFVVVPTGNNPVPLGRPAVCAIVSPGQLSVDVTA